VFGAGFAVAGLGGVFELNAASYRDAYDRAVARTCEPVACPRGTSIDPHDLARESLYNWIALGVISAGIATIATGAAMLYVNRGRTIYPDVEPRAGGATLGLAGRF
jgi:hypothetical protein